MDRKNDIKVDSFIHLGNYYSLDRVTHGSENYNKGYCLVEFNNELYLADTLEEEIHTEHEGMRGGGELRRERAASDHDLQPRESLH